MNLVKKSDSELKSIAMSIQSEHFPYKEKALEELLRRARINPAEELAKEVLEGATPEVRMEALEKLIVCENIPDGTFYKILRTSNDPLLCQRLIRHMNPDGDDLP